MRIMAFRDLPVPEAKNAAISEKQFRPAGMEPSASRATVAPRGTDVGSCWELESDPTFLRVGGRDRQRGAGVGAMNWPTGCGFTLARQPPAPAAGLSGET